VLASASEAEKDRVVVPTTMEEYCMKPKKNSNATSASVDNIEIDDFYDMDDDDDYGLSDEEEEEEDADDSGNGES